jgi:hypothetical protein
VLAGACYLTTGYGRLNLLFQPNSFEVFSFTLATYLLVRHAQPDGRPRHLYWLGLVLGLGVLNKYTTFFFGAAALGALLLTAPRAFMRPPIWLAAGLALLVAAPTLGWQVAHGLPFRHHMALLHDQQLVNVTLGNFWKEQVLMNLSALLVWVPGLWAALRGRPAPAARVAGLLYLGGMLILNLLHGKGYYALGYYPALFAVGAVWWQARLAARPQLRMALLALPFLLLAPFVCIIYPLLPPPQMVRLGQTPAYERLGINRWEDGQIHPLPQDFADMLGWQELAAKTYQAYQALPDSTRAATLIKCDNYGQAGAINYYNRGRQLPTATSFNGSYLHWFPVAPERPWRHLLLVGEGHPAELVSHFQTFRKVGEIMNPYARERGATIYLGTGPSPTLLARVAAERQAALADWENNIPR